jgi:eukaryotic-like serine/threonine-protein kinase
MTLAIGVRCGPYEITTKIGAGGMGEVYRARDTKLDRDVALKILAEAFARDPERLPRFEREAKILAALNHPHIAHIHGLEESGFVRALVLEFVDGPTLADRIAQGPIPIVERLNHRPPDCWRARGRSRPGHHPSRFEAGEHQAAA